MLKQVLGSEPQTAAIGSSHDLDIENRIAAQLDEPIANADPIDPEHSLPNIDECFFLRRAGSNIMPIVGADLAAWIRKRRSVELSITGQRKCIEPNDERRDHVLRDPLREVRAHLGGRHPHVLGDVIADQSQFESPQARCVV